MRWFDLNMKFIKIMLAFVVLLSLLDTPFPEVLSKKN